MWCAARSPVVKTLMKTGWTWRWWRHLPNVTRLPTLGRSVAKYFPSWQIRCALPNSFVIFLVWPTIDLRTPNAIALPHYGRGGPVKSLRVRPWQQFGERSITLSNKETIKISNVMIPERVVKQYLADCDRMSFKPLRRSTLLRILAVCPASVWKSLQA